MNENMNQEMNNYSNNNGNMMDLNMVSQGNMEQNYGDNVSELDLMLQEKIKKREKTDTMIAYALIAILLICIVVVTCLKIFRKEEVPVVDEYVPQQISIAEIASSLNDSNLANNYRNENATFSSNEVGNSLVVTYVKDDVNLNLNIPVMGLELEVTMPETNTQIATEIYKEIASIVCVFYGNDEASCRDTLENVSSDYTVDGIRYAVSDDNNKVYVNISKSIALEVVYSDVTKMGIDITEYALNLENYEIRAIGIEPNDTSINFSGKVTKSSDDTNTFSVIVKLYDSSDNLLGENKYEFNDENKYEENNEFNIEFLFNDSLTLGSIANYSIEISKGE